MKFKLMAAARQETSLRPSDHRLRLGTRLLIAAFVVTAAATAGGYAAKTLRVPGPVAPETAQKLSHTDARGLEVNLHARLATNLTNQSPSIAAPASQNSPAVAGSPVPGTSDFAGDARFTEAWAALRAKRPAEAARDFDALLNSPSLDPARRADVVYWSAQSHRQAGNVGVAQSRSAQLLRQYPSSPFASEAALILGEYALAGDQFDAAAQYLTKAATSDHPVVRERAKHALRELVKKDTGDLR